MVISMVIVCVVRRSMYMNPFTFTVHVCICNHCFLIRNVCRYSAETGKSKGVYNGIKEKKTGVWG